MSEIDLSGKVAIVTGAGGGFGGAMTLALAGVGANGVAGHRIPGFMIRRIVSRTRPNPIHTVVC